MNVTKIMILGDWVDGRDLLKLKLMIEKWKMMKQNENDRKNDKNKWFEYKILMKNEKKKKNWKRLKQEKVSLMLNKKFDPK